MTTQQFSKKLLGKKQNTHMLYYRLSIKVYENGFVIKPIRNQGQGLCPEQPAIFLTKESAEYLRLALYRWEKVNEIADEVIKNKIDNDTQLIEKEVRVVKKMVEKVTHEELGKLLKIYYQKKLPMFVWGTFGIGKSQVVKQEAKVIAESKGRIFIDWNKTDAQQKADVLANPKKYFVLQDIRLSEYDSSDIKGLPDFTGNKRSIEFRVPTWALLLENPESDGILFFDEINLATPLVVSSCYKIIYDRIVNDTKINDNWLIMGCGNKSEDRAYTHDVSPPLRDRGGEVELTFNTDNWINWAVQLPPEQAICSEIIGYLSFKSGDLYRVNFEDEGKFTTPRGWERVNTLIKDIVTTHDYNTMRLVVCSAIGEGVGSEFVSYCKIKEQINLPELIKNPKKIADISDKDINIKFFVCTAVAEQYRDKKIDFAKVLDVSKVLDSVKNAELVAYLWKLCSGYNAKKFKEDFVKKVDTAFAEKYGKYIIA